METVRKTSTLRMNVIFLCFKTKQHDVCKIGQILDHNMCFILKRNIWIFRGYSMRF